MNAAAAATYSRFLPKMKARFDYGVAIFILTYTLVAVGGYRVNEVAFMAQHRLTTIAIGAMICFAVCALVFPVWAGKELHDQVARNMDKLAAAVESCVEDYFSEATAGVDVAAAAAPKPALSDKSHGYKAVLNAKDSEDSLANLATWEPAHASSVSATRTICTRRSAQRCAPVPTASTPSLPASAQRPKRQRTSRSTSPAPPPL